jgi:D-alanine-D-alanine ligase
MKVAIIYNKDISGVINTFGMQNKEFYSETAVNNVAKCLEKAGHNVAVLDGNMYIIDRLQKFMPRVIENEQMGMVFNMAYGIQGESRYTHIPSLLEMLGIPYVGSNPSGHALALDKVMTKIIWQNHGISTPDFWVINNADDDLSLVKYPVIVKPKMESVSFGLKVVYNEEDLKEAVHFIVTEFQQQALVEQFISGREFAIGIIGNSPVETFPVLEIDLGNDPDAIQTVDDKQTKPKRKICPADLPEDLAQEMQRVSVEAFNALNLRDFARVDIRMDQDGKFYLLEINSMASLGNTGSYPTAARVAGYDFEKLVNKMLEVATIRYFSTSHHMEEVNLKGLNQPIHSRLRTFIKGRESQSDRLLEKLVNINTHVRNVEGVNQCSRVIQSELSRLGFAHEIYPQMEVGNIMYFTNSYNQDVDYLLLLSVDTPTPLSQHENFSNNKEDVITGSGVWENKGGISVALTALQTLRSSKSLKKTRIGVLLITDSCIGGKYSAPIIKRIALNSQHVISLYGGNQEGSVVTSRSGSALYNYELKLNDCTNASNVNIAASLFHKSLFSFTEIGSKTAETLVAPYNVKFNSNIFKVFAYGSAKISLRFNSMSDFDKADDLFRRSLKLSKSGNKITHVQFEGGVNRPPFEKDDQIEEFYQRIKKIASKIDTRIVEEHRWSSADISVTQKGIPRIDGLGPVGGYDNSNIEFIYKHSLVDRALLLSLILSNKY